MCRDVIYAHQQVLQIRWGRCREQGLLFPLRTGPFCVGELRCRYSYMSRLDAIVGTLHCSFLITLFPYLHRMTSAHR